MKKIILKSALVISASVLPIASVSAQGLLSKAKKTVETVSSQNSETTISDETATSSAKTVLTDSIPFYHVQAVYETDANGDTLKNEDGTVIERYFLVDQFGNYRSPEAVEAQHKAINKAIGNILAKVGSGAALGALSGGTKGAITGAIAGLGLSAKDIIKIKDQSKSLRQQKKLLEAFKKNITSEGLKVDAKADLSNIKDLAINKDEAVSKSTDDIKAMCESEQFKNSDTSAWDSLGDL